VALITRENLKVWLGITTTAEDDFLDDVVAGVDAGVKSFLRRDIEQATYTEELYDGNGREYFYLREYPVTSVTEIRITNQRVGGVNNDAAFTDDTVQVYGTDFVMKREDEVEENVGILLAVRSIWPRGEANIRATYVAGYTTVPADIVMACYQLAAQLRVMRKTGLVKSMEQLGDYSYTILTSPAYFANAAVTDARHKLARYRRVS
jgi:hypothetical protein